MDRTTSNWPLILLLWTTGLLAAAQFAKLTLTLEGVGAAYPDMPVSLAVSGVSVVGILGGAVAGFIVARIGARRAVLWATGLSLAVALFEALDTSFAVFMSARIAEGVGHLLFVVALPTLMAVLAKPGDKSVVMGLWGTFFGTSYAVLALIIPSVENWGGIRAVYLGHAVLLAAIFPLLWFAVPRIMLPRGDMPNVIALHRQIYTTPRAFAPGLGHGIYTSLLIALVAFLPGQLDALWLTPLLPLFNLAGTFASGFIARHISASLLSVVCFGLSAVLFALTGLTGSPIVALLAMISTGVTAGANFAAVPELNSDPRDQALANGAMAQIGNIGTFSGTPIFALAVAGGLWGVAGLSVAICIGGVVFAGLAYKAARRG